MQAIRFGPYELRSYVLLRRGRPLAIGSRGLLLLEALVTRMGQVVSHHDLRRAAWPDTYVNDTNLRVQILALRRVLAEEPGLSIVNHPGRGYALFESAEVFG